MPGILRNKSKNPVPSEKKRKIGKPGADATGSGSKTGSQPGKAGGKKMETYPVKATVIAKEKRHDPVKHYVFIVEVIWSDNSRIPIYRQYSDFTQLHSELSDYLNSSSEENNKHQLPHFPVKKVFQRNEISKNASRRRHAFDDYCQALLKMDKLISQHKQVISFFKARDSDINPLTQSQAKTGKNRSSLLQALADLVPGSKKQNGGNIKESKSSGDLQYLAEEDDPIYVSSPIVCESYTAVADYTPQGKGELKLKEGQLVEVVEKYANGWWFIQTEYGFGWTPATYLTQVTQKNPEEEPEPVYSGHQYITTKAYKAEFDDELTFEKGVLVNVLHKLMDGWWIVSYQGEVGYAPATYMVSFLNPHFRDSRYGQIQNRKPTNRRGTIKNSSGKFVKDTKKRELSLYKSMHQKVEEIRRKRAESSQQKQQQQVSEREDAKPQEYEYMDEQQIEEVQDWATSTIGPPLPPRPDNLSSPFREVIDVNGAQRKEAMRRHSSADASGLVYVKKPTFHLNTLPPGTTFNKAPSSPRKRIQSADTEASVLAGTDGTSIDPRAYRQRLSVPEICIIGCDSSIDETGEMNDSSSEEETVESLYATSKEVKPKPPRTSPIEVCSNIHTEERLGDEAGVAGCGDDSSDEEETVENLYSNSASVRQIMRTKVHGKQGTVEYTNMDKSKGMGSNENAQQYMNMGRCSQVIGDGDECNEREVKVERTVDRPERRVQREVKQGSEASGTDKMEVSSAQNEGSLKGQEAMDTLIQSLRNQSIRGVYTNEKGELCFQFEKK